MVRAALSAGLTHDPIVSAASSSPRWRVRRRGRAQAHPHVWVTMKSEVVYAPDGTATGVRHAWTFDDMFSTFATQGLAEQGKGQVHPRGAGAARRR